MKAAAARREEDMPGATEKKSKEGSKTKGLSAGVKGNGAKDRKGDGQDQEDEVKMKLNAFL